MSRLLQSATAVAVTHLLIISSSSNSNICLALNVLVVGGSGRVGGSTVRWLQTLSDRQKREISIAVGGRNRESYDAAIRNNVIPPSGVDFFPMDIDGDVSALFRSLKRWKSACTTSDYFLVVNTAGPFQGRRYPTLLSSCLDLSLPYIDVCDEWELAKASKLELDRKAKDAGVPAIVSCGIWPGVSALMAAEGVSQLKESFGEEVCIDAIDYSFFTAGTGNAGPTIVSATFLLLATEVITFVNGERKDVEPWTGKREVDFGTNIGYRSVWLLDNPDVPTTALYLTKGKQEIPPNCSSRFGTAPLFWNYLFGAMKVLPKSLLYNRLMMQKLSIFSEPIIRLVDMLVGATNAMRVDITTAPIEGGQRGEITLRMAHPDLEQCVGLATAAFALEVARSVKKKEARATVQPGVWFPVELGKEARENILRVSIEDTLICELGLNFK